MTGLPTMQTRRQALAEKVRALAEAHLPRSRRLAVETRIRAALLDTPSPRDRRKVMGDPVCYIRIAYDGPAGTGAQDINAGDDTRPLRFRVMFWLEYEDARRHADSSEALFDDVLEGRPGALGLWSGLRAAGYLKAKAGPAGEDVVPIDVAFDGAEPPTLVVLNTRSDLYAHYAECVVTLS